MFGKYTPPHLDFTSIFERFFALRQQFCHKNVPGTPKKQGTWNVFVGKASPVYLLEIDDDLPEDEAGGDGLYAGTGDEAEEGAHSGLQSFLAGFLSPMNLSNEGPEE